MRVALVTLIYTIAFMAGLATLWAMLALGLMQFFESRIDSIFITTMFALLAAMCMFSLIYGLGTGVALKWQYWLFGTLFMAALVLVTPWIMTMANLTPLRGFVFGGLAIYLVGLLFALKRDVRLSATSDAH